MSLTSAAAVHTRRRPVGSDCWSPPPFWSGGGMFLTGGPLGGVDGAGCGGTLPAGSAAIVPSGVHANGPGPFLICALTEPSASAILYACPPSSSATMPYPASFADTIGVPAGTVERSSTSRPANTAPAGTSTVEVLPPATTVATLVGLVGVLCGGFTSR